MLLLVRIVLQVNIDLLLVLPVIHVQLVMNAQLGPQFNVLLELTQLMVC